MSTPADFRFVRDTRWGRWFFRGQLAAAVFWTYFGVRLLVADRQLVLGSLLAVAGVVLALSLVAVRRAGIAVDDKGIRWRGLIRSEAVAWGDVEGLVIDDRGRPWEKFGVDLQLKDGTKRSVPHDAVAGLEQEGNAELRKRLVDALFACANGAGVRVLRPDVDDPLVS